MLWSRNCFGWETSHNGEAADRRSQSHICLLKREVRKAAVGLGELLLQWKVSKHLVTYRNTHIFHHALPVLPMTIPLYTSFSDSRQFARSLPYKAKETQWQGWCSVTMQKSILMARQISWASNCETKWQKLYSSPWWIRQFCSSSQKNVACCRLFRCDMITTN